MSALFEEAAVCNYRCFSSLVAKTTSKCSYVTWPGVTGETIIGELVCLHWRSHDSPPFRRPPFPSFLKASSAFEVAMWKSLATNPNKYNNRVISSLPQ